jgi:hypothetical protein
VKLIFVESLPSGRKRDIPSRFVHKAVSIIVRKLSPPDARQEVFQKREREREERSFVGRETLALL